MKNGVLLIGGSPRSGTTAVLQVLNSAPGVFISSEENLLKSVQVLEKLLDTRTRRAKALQNGMRELSPRETLTLDSIHSHNFDRSAVWPTLHFIYSHHHAQLHPGAALQLWGDKLPAYAREIDQVLSLPGVRYLHVTRNPLDVVNSMLRRLEAARLGRDWWKSITDFDAMLEAWVAAFQAIEQVEARHDVLHLHYEDLVFDFERSVSGLNGFLHADFDFRNVLVDEPAKHFDRSQLLPEMVRRIAAHSCVQRYVERVRPRMARIPHAAFALAPLLS
ncbi:sulfotransferase [Methyloversatilis sp. XJ19-49]|uniref:sulfotransferase family protein n=1 Tax=Methyloversatilis sp. XJ19-49 TaxID=2963429 RepID=UPI00211C41CC|nr:sulfotransferase [Methyloversatilis sp. XJ19-49]MCQ9378580.1 sulfotransferase [Methyloversatilis sp. XJ19-49]